MFPKDPDLEFGQIFLEVFHIFSFSSLPTWGSNTEIDVFFSVTIDVTIIEEVLHIETISCCMENKCNQFYKYVLLTIVLSS